MRKGSIFDFFEISPISKKTRPHVKKMSQRVQRTESKNRFKERKKEKKCKDKSMRFRFHLKTYFFRSTAFL